MNYLNKISVLLLVVLLLVNCTTTEVKKVKPKLNEGLEIQREIGDIYHPFSRVIFNEGKVKYEVTLGSSELFYLPKERLVELEKNNHGWLESISVEILESQNLSRSYYLNELRKYMVITDTYHQNKTFIYSINYHDTIFYLFNTKEQRKGVEIIEKLFSRFSIIEESVANRYNKEYLIPENRDTYFFDKNIDSINKIMHWLGI